jgi:hypothetical protein
MIGKKPETPEEQWQAIVNFANQPIPDEEDESDEKVSADLRAMGMDPEAVGRRGRELVEKLAREADEARALRATEAEIPRVAKAVPAEPSPERTHSETGHGFFGPWAAIQIAAAALLFSLVTVGAAVAYFQEQTSPHGLPEHDEAPGPTPNQLAAKKLRVEAKERCAAADWESCLVKLDDAKALDPAGDLVPEVKAERVQANRAVRDEQRRREETPPDHGKSSKGDKAPGASH